MKTVRLRLEICRLRLEILWHVSMTRLCLWLSGELTTAERRRMSQALFRYGLDFNAAERWARARST